LFRDFKNVAKQRTSKAREIGVPSVTPGERIVKERGRGVVEKTVYKNAPTVDN